MAKIIDSANGETSYLLKDLINALIRNITKLPNIITINGYNIAILPYSTIYVKNMG